MNIHEPSDLVDYLIAIFPEFVQECGDGDEYEGDDTYHSVFLTFGPESFKLLNDAKPEQIRVFCDLINYSVECDGLLENAVSTCFLEHASQLGVKKIIKAYLSKKAMNELR